MEEEREKKKERKKDISPCCHGLSPVRLATWKADIGRTEV
jgi:hypothetical protein